MRSVSSRLEAPDRAQLPLLRLRRVSPGRRRWREPPPPAARCSSARVPHARAQPVDQRVPHRRVAHQQLGQPIAGAEQRRQHPRQLRLDRAAAAISRVRAAPDQIAKVQQRPIRIGRRDRLLQQRRGQARAHQLQRVGRRLDVAKAGRRRQPLELGAIAQRIEQARRLQVQRRAAARPASPRSPRPPRACSRTSASKAASVVESQPGREACARARRRRAAGGAAPPVATCTRCSSRRQKR